MPNLLYLKWNKFVECKIFHLLCIFICDRASRGSSSITSDGGIPEIPVHRDSEVSEVFDDDPGVSPTRNTQDDTAANQEALPPRRSSQNSDSAVVVHTTEEGGISSEMDQSTAGATEANGNATNVGTEVESVEEREEGELIGFEVHGHGIGRLDRGAAVER